jgi:serine protease inhibitor
MKKTSLITIVLLFSVMFSCKKDNNSTNNLNPSNSIFTANEKKLGSIDNVFGFDFFKLINNSAATNQNVMVSPLSVALALGMTYNGSDGTTKAAMEQALDLNGMTVSEINIAYKGLIDKLASLDNNVVFNIANSIWYRNTFSVLPDFINTNKTYFYAQVTPLDFDLPSAQDSINHWVADKTNNKIDKIVEGIDPLTVMFLINAIYFKGTWKYTFDKNSTALFPFTLKDNTVKQVNMMSEKADFMVLSNEIFIAAELPYGTSQYSMIVLVPYNNTDDIISQLNDQNWKTWLSQFKLIKDFSVFLPKFKFDYEQELKDILAQMGMGIAFTDNANFSKINPEENLYISAVKHKTYIDVDEQGTEAAAVTSVVVGTTSVGEQPTQLIANRPFLFVIKENSTNTILFIGKISDPEYN